MAENCPKPFYVIYFPVPSDSSLLVIVVDTNPNQSYISEDPKALTHILDAVIAFANSHLMQKARNQLAVIGCHFHKRYCSESIDFLLRIK